MSKKMNINSAQGWAKVAEETNRKSFISEMGREPHSYAEVKAWVDACVEAALAGCEEPEKPEPTLEVFNGELHLVTNFWKGEATV